MNSISYSENPPPTYSFGPDDLKVPSEVIFLDDTPFSASEAALPALLFFLPILDNLIFGPAFSTG